MLFLGQACGRPGACGHHVGDPDLVLFHHEMYRIYSLISCTFLPGMWPVFCLRLICATYPEGQSFRMSYHRISIIQSNRKCHSARTVTSLGHQGWQRVFWEEPKFFKLCPIIFSYAQHIFPGGAKIFVNRVLTPLRPPGYGPAFGSGRK